LPPEKEIRPRTSRRTCCALPAATWPDAADTPGSIVIVVATSSHRHRRRRLEPCVSPRPRVRTGTRPQHPRLPRSAAGRRAVAPRPSHRPEPLSAGATELLPHDCTDRTPPAGEPPFELRRLRTHRPTPKPASPTAHVEPPTGSSEPQSPHPGVPPSGHPFR
jgi:hypothetical protein